ncbi:MAG: type II toxin-antitoxin system VapB family antitoxin [Acidobacteria bacterium]|nr:type II toxin-antitoxin system VapB family antitoxin [Acidobacteriota bacterium]MCH8985241.1 type II toxin-antitoxin system VapB family antitoxin [Acidobacteriota bacterium]
MGRTNLVIDDNLLDIVMRRYNIHTKTEAVDVALRHLAGQPMTTAEALAMRGSIPDYQVPEDRGPR